MNECSVSYKRACGGYYAMLRLPRDGGLKPIVGKGGMAIIYDTPLAALEASSSHLCKWINGNLVRDGERLSPGRSEAEKMFPGLKRRAVA